MPLTRAQRVRVFTLCSLVLLYALASLAHISFTLTSQYKRNRPEPNALNGVAPCVPDSPLPDTSLCRHCTLLTASTHSHCIECNATLPTLCDNRTPKERHDSNARYEVRVLQYRRDFINSYARTRGWFMWLLPRSDYIGDQSYMDTIVGWTLEQAPLQVDPVGLACSIAFCCVLVTLVLALVYNKMCVDADYRDRANALAQQASAAIAGAAEKAGAADEASGSSMDPDVWGLGLSKRIQ